MEESEIDIQDRKRMYFKLYAKQYFERNKERVKLYRQQYYLKNIDRLSESYRQRYRRIKGDEEIRPYNRKGDRAHEEIPVRIVDKIVVSFR